MRTFARRTLVAAVAVPALAGLTMLGAGAVSAAPAAAAHTTHPAVRMSLVSQFYSQFLAGTFLNGNGAVSFAGTWRQLTVPNESAAIPAIAPDHLAVGLVLSQYVTGGYADAEALVWSDTVHTGSCGLDQWTLEYTPAAYDIVTPVTSPMPVPTSALIPITSGGAPVVCVNGAGSVFTYLYHSGGHNELQFSAGPTSGNWNVLATDYHQHITFRSGASGVTTTDGTDAANLVSGLPPVASSGVGYFESGHGNSKFGDGRNLRELNYSVVQGTLTGGPPTAVNPLTLSVNPTVVGLPYGAYQIDAP